MGSKSRVEKAIALPQLTYKIVAQFKSGPNIVLVGIPQWLN